MCKIIDKTDKTFWNKELDVVLLEEDFPKIDQSFEYSFGENLDKIVLELEGLLSSDIKEDDLDIIQDYMQLAFLSGHEEGMKDFLEGAKLFPKTPDYADNGNKTSSTYYDSVGNVECSCKYLYDDNGSMTSNIWYDSKGNMTSSTYYDSEGNKTSETWYDSEGNVLESWKFIYDSKGTQTSKTRYDSEGNVMVSYKYTYDGEGNMTSEAWYDSEGNEI